MVIKYFDDLKCFWMKSGTVDYRLCDNNFNCDDCVFNLNIRKSLFPEVNNADKSDFSETKNNSKESEILKLSGDTMFDESLIKQMNFNERYYHLSNGLILKNLVFGIFYIGLDSYIRTILTEDTKIEFISESNRITKGTGFLSLTGSWGRIKINSPFDFTFIEKFEPGKTLSNQIKWLGVIEAELLKLEKIKLTEKSLDEKLRFVKDEVVKMAREKTLASDTMLDGGTTLIEFIKSTDKKVYKKILNFFLKE